MTDQLQSMLIEYHVVSVPCKCINVLSSVKNVHSDIILKGYKDEALQDI